MRVLDILIHSVIFVFLKYVPLVPILIDFATGAAYDHVSSVRNVHWWHEGA